MVYIVMYSYCTAWKFYFMFKNRIVELQSIYFQPPTCHAQLILQKLLWLRFMAMSVKLKPLSNFHSYSYVHNYVNLQLLVSRLSPIICNMIHSFNTSHRVSVVGILGIPSTQNTLIEHSNRIVILKYWEWTLCTGRNFYNSDNIPVICHEGNILEVKLQLSKKIIRKLAMWKFSLHK